MSSVPAWTGSLVPAPKQHAAEWGANLVFWIVATLIAVFFATLLRESAFFDGHYLPRTNDSLYHARRILDTALGERGFYQFDERLHVPDGAWIPWPWAYDWLVAQALRAALWVSPGSDPMAFLSYIAVVWVGVNAALFLACLHGIGLPAGLRAVAMLGFALSPLIQLTHATAMIDHHFVELTFVLLSIWLALRWLDDGGNRPRAALLGLALGISVAFHNGLFILQLPLLAALFVLWLKGQRMPLGSIRVLAGTLVATTLLVALPSAPLRAGFFDFALLSWFHVYIAVCSAVTLLFLGTYECSPKRLGVLVGLAAALGAPILAQAVRGALFFAGDLVMLDEVLEAQSPFRMIVETVGLTETASYYGWLILAAPLIAAWFAWTAYRHNAAGVVFYAVWAVFGLAMLLLQYRFFYFGLLFLISGPLLMLDSLARRRQLRPGLVLAGALGALAVLYQPALRERLFIIYAAGGDRDYMGGLAAFDHLAELCAEHPGTVLANSNDGNAILYHTECSVIANNFIMRPEDERKLNEIVELMQSTPEAIRQHEPPIDYLFLRVRDFAHLIDGELVLDTQNRLSREFLIADEPPPGFERTKNLVYRVEESGQMRLYGRVFRVLPGTD